MLRISNLDYIFVLRPMLFFPGWSTMLAGALIPYKKQILFSRDSLAMQTNTELGILMISFGAAMGASFLLNQLRDIQGDLKNEKLFIISKGYISKRSAMIEVGVLCLLSLIPALWAGTGLFFIVAGFILLTGYLYNFAPFNLKDHTWGSLLSNAAMGCFAFATGWFWKQSFHPAFFADLMPYLMLNTALYLYTTLPDMEGDRQSHKMTPAVRLGLDRILVISFMLFISGFLITFILHDYLALFIYSLSSPFFIATMIKRTLAGAIRATKFSIFFFSLAVSLKVPAYFILMVAGFFLTRWYFKVRFYFDYPNFRGK